LTRLYLFLFVCYILIESGTGLYKYSYYANNIFVRGTFHVLYDFIVVTVSQFGYLNLISKAFHIAIFHVIFKYKIVSSYIK